MVSMISLDISSTEPTEATRYQRKSRHGASLWKDKRCNVDIGYLEVNGYQVPLDVTKRTVPDLTGQARHYLHLPPLEVLLSNSALAADHGHVQAEGAATQKSSVAGQGARLPFAENASLRNFATHDALFGSCEEESLS